MGLALASLAAAFSPSSRAARCGQIKGFARTRARRWLALASPCRAADLAAAAFQAALVYRRKRPPYKLSRSVRYRTITPSRQGGDSGIGVPLTTAY
jgi:hypothetical protein